MNKNPGYPEISGKINLHKPFYAKNEPNKGLF